MTLFARAAAVIVLLLLSQTGLAHAQATPARAPTTIVDVHSLPTMAVPVKFDAHRAVEAYLRRISGPARARSDAYFEGGYVLQLIDVLYALGVAAFLLWSRASSRMRNIAASLTRSRFLQVPLYVGQYVVVTSILVFPLTVYEGFIREHAYGLSNQNFLQWLGDQGTGFLLSLFAALFVLTLIYAAIRRAPRTWWAWGTVIVVAFLFFETVITPVFVLPLFNHYTQLPASPVRAQIQSMARSNGIPAENVYEFDASRQSNRISANVSGFLGTTQISMTDNLLKNCSPAEIEAVLGHEMGHYVLSHQVILITWLGLLILAGFGFLNWSFYALVDIFGGNWDVRTIDDPAGIPILAAMLSVFTLLSTPIQNTITRTAEIQADMFGLNTARQPDGFATVTLKLSTYRKLDPTPLEEFVFYDHPSGRTRLWEAMRWKAEHLNDPDIKSGPNSPQ
jgi:STE24 endopeptidase